MQQRDSHWADFREIRRFFENPSRKFDFDYYFRITSTVREGLCTYSTVSRWILLRTRHVSVKFVQKIIASILCSVIFSFGKSCPLWDYVQSTERIVTFPLQQWLRERVTYTVFFFCLFSVSQTRFLPCFVSYLPSCSSPNMQVEAAISSETLLPSTKLHGVRLWNLRLLWQLQISNFVC